MGTNEDTVREAAYCKWLEAGSPPGDGVEFWLAAEQECCSGQQCAEDDAIDEASEESFPASDPPSHGSTTAPVSSPPASSTGRRKK